MGLKEHAAAIRERVARAAALAGRKPSDVLLVGVTKTRSVQEMQEVASLVDAIGENKVQEAQVKREAWGDHPTPPGG